MALRVPETNFWDHFSIQTSPQNPQKGTLGPQIEPQKLIFGHFAFFWYFCPIFPWARGKIFKCVFTAEGVLKSKNSKLKSVLKLNFLSNSNCASLNFDFWFLTEPYCSTSRRMSIRILVNSCWSMVHHSLACGSWKPGQSWEINPILFLGFTSTDVSTLPFSYFLFWDLRVRCVCTFPPVLVALESRLDSIPLEDWWRCSCPETLNFCLFVESDLELLLLSGDLEFLFTRHFELLIVLQDLTSLSPQFLSLLKSEGTHRTQCYSLETVFE